MRLCFMKQGKKLEFNDVLGSDCVLCDDKLAEVDRGRCLLSPVCSTRVDHTFCDRLRDNHRDCPARGIDWCVRAHPLSVLRIGWMFLLTHRPPPQESCPFFFPKVERYVDGMLWWRVG